MRGIVTGRERPIEPPEPPRETPPPALSTWSADSGGRRRPASRPPAVQQGAPADLRPRPGDVAAADGPGGPGAPRIQVVAERLLSALGRAGVARALMVIDRDKMDIPRYFADRAPRPPRQADPPALAFVPVHRSPSVPHSLAGGPAVPRRVARRSRISRRPVHPGDAFARIDATGAGAARRWSWVSSRRPTRDHRHGRGRRRRPRAADRGPPPPFVPEAQLADRSLGPALHHLACSPLGRQPPRLGGERRARARDARPAADRDARELQLGALFAEALADGLPIEGVPFPDGAYLDVGTPEGYSRALAAFDPPRISPPPLIRGGGGGPAEAPRSPYVAVT